MIISSARWDTPLPAQPGVLLQSVVASVEAGLFGSASPLELAVGEAIVGAAAGAITTLVVGLFRKEVGQKKPG